MASNFRLFSRLGLLGAGSTALAHFTPFSGHGSSTNGGRSGTGPARCDGNFLDDEKDTAGFVGVFLDQASIDKVKQHGLLGGPAGASLGRTPHALVHLHPDPETRRSFAPLFGSKAKVLVRGVAEDVSTHQKVMIVEVSVGANSKNKIVSRQSIPTISFSSEKWEDDVSDLLGVDLARRLLENGSLHAKGSWDGVLPAQVLDGIKYPPTRAIFTEAEEPIALEGTICASINYDKKAAECVVTKRQEEKPVKEEEEGQEEPAGEKGECPLCTYMMNSPCKDVFVVFKACIDKASDSNESADLKECESSASDVHACIHKYGLFRDENDGEGEEAVAASPAGTAVASLAATPTSATNVQATSPQKDDK